MSKLFSERLKKKDEPESLIPGGTFRFRFNGTDEPFIKPHFKAWFTPVTFNYDYTNIPEAGSVEVDLQIDAVDNDRVEATATEAVGTTPDTEVVEHLDYEVEIGEEVVVDVVDKSAVIADRKQYSKLSLWELTKKLGAGYELRTLQKLFFGDVAGGVPAWRNNIIRYYLQDQGWEVDKDPVPQWVEYKYVANVESQSEDLVVYTPMPGLLGREAAFGFVRWDLKYGEGRQFYRYQENKADYESANDAATLSKHLSEHKNALMGTTTKEEQLFDETYIPKAPKTAIVLAYELVSDFETYLYIQNPTVQKEGSYFNHHDYVRLNELLSTTVSGLFGSVVKDYKGSRRDNFVTNKKGASSFNSVTMEGLETVSPSKASFVIPKTTLGFAKQIFIEGNSYSGTDLEEEGIGANMLIRYFDRFKESIGKAVFFLEAYSALSYDAQAKANAAIGVYKNTILNAYLFPEELVDFSKGDALMDEAYSFLHASVYGKGGIFDERLDFATKSLIELRNNPHVKGYTGVFAYIDEALASKRPAVPTGGGSADQVDLKPLAKLEIALGMIDVMAQVAMLGGLVDKHVPLPNTDKFYSPFLTVLLNLNSTALYRGEGYEGVLMQDIDRGRALIVDPKYAQGLDIDLFVNNVFMDLEQSQMTGLLMAAAIVTFWAGGVLAQAVGSIVRTGMVTAGFSATAFVTSAAVVTTEMVVGGVSSALMFHLVEVAVTDKKFGEGLGKEMLLNTFLFGVGKLVEVAIIAEEGAMAANNAEKIGEGVWKANLGERIIYYVERSFVTPTTVLRGGPELAGPFADYPILQSQFTQVRTTLRNAALDENLVENSLRTADKATLDYFEKNPAKLIEATEKLPGEIPAITKLGPGTRIVETTKYLDGFAKGEFDIVDDLITLSRKEFDGFTSEWIKINPHNGKEMFNSDSGGYVLCHKQHNIKIGDLDSQAEFATAEALAANGEKVVLLSENAPLGVKTPDAEIITKGIFDFKNVNSTTGNGIQTNVRDYVMNPSKRSNADGVVFNIQNNPNATPDMINQGVLDAISTVANESNLAKKIGIIYSDGTSKIILIDEFKNTTNGARF